MKRQKKARKKETGSIGIKIIAIFCALLVASLTYISADSFALMNQENSNSKEILPLASAAGDTGCCTKTNNGAYCAPNVEQSNCTGGTFYPNQTCMNAGISECKTTVCIEADGSCDAAKYSVQCADNGGFPSPEKDITKIEGCQPTCCVFRIGEVIQSTEYHFFEKKCEVLADKYNMQVDTRDDLNYQDCVTLTPPEREGYCWMQESCFYTTKGDCDNKGGTFKNEKCPNCISHAKTKCYTDGNSYWYNSCGEREGLQNNQECAVGQSVCRVNETTGNSSCQQINCNITLSDTTLGYNTSFLKVGEIGVKDKNGESNKKSGDNISLNNGESACVQYQGPGEAHFIYSCQNGDVIANALSEDREQICNYSSIAYWKANNYIKCGSCGNDSDPNVAKYKWYRADWAKNLDWLGQAFSFLGADLITPKWWDMWTTIGGPTGLCDGTEDCQGLGDCQLTEKNNDCVPKYAPASSSLCGDCMTSTAGDPWNQCGTEEQCQSRGNCQWEKIEPNFWATLSICTIETVASGLIYKFISGLFKKETKALDKKEK
ncbi:hypothetical protein COS75_03505, partial [Candidatus Pacearchaeota archaeon CG06_land_8_20_14_3_00_35_12]